MSRALLYCPYTDVRAILGLRHIQDFVVVEPKSDYLPSFFCDPNKMLIIKHRWTDRFSTDNVSLALMIEAYYSIGFVISEDTKTLDSPITFQCMLDDRVIKLYHCTTLDNLDNVSDLIKDLRTCETVVDTTSCLIPKECLKYLPEAFDFYGLPYEVRYNKDTVEDLFEGRLRGVFMIHDTVAPDLDYMFLGPHKDGFHNHLLQLLLYPPSFTELKSIEDLCHQVVEDDDCVAC